MRQRYLVYSTKNPESFLIADSHENLITLIKTLSDEWGYSLIDRVTARDVRTELSGRVMR